MKNNQETKNAQKAVMRPNGFALWIKLALILFTSSAICGTIYNTEYGFQDYKGISGLLSSDYYVQLDGVNCLGCPAGIVTNSTGNCATYMDDDGKVLALHDGTNYLNLNDYINQKIDLTTCSFTVLYKFLVSFLTQPVADSFENAVFVVDEGAEISECDREWYDNLAGTQDKLEEHYAKQNIILIANSSDAMELIRRFYDIEELKLAKKDQSQTPVFSGAFNSLKLEFVVSGQNLEECGPIQAVLAAEKEEQTELEDRKNNLESQLEPLRQGNQQILGEIASLQGQLDDARPDSGDEPGVDEKVIELTSEIENLTGQLSKARKTVNNNKIALIAVSVVAGLIVIGAAAFIFMRICK